MRVLIVGAGIGGLTLAALLRRWNVKPDLIDRAPNFEHAGYMLGLYPLGSRILHGLGAFADFVAASDPMDYYALANGKGDVINRYDLGVVTHRFGPIRQTSRGELLTLLAAAAGHPPVRMGVALEAVEQHDNQVMARTSDGEVRRYDLVVGADGIHSAVRRQVFGQSATFDTGWGGWVWWADPALVPHDTVTEYWGAGRFLGVYPTKHRIGIVACGPIRNMDPDDRTGRRDRMLRLFAALDGKAGAILHSLPGDEEELFFWKLADQRAESRTASSCSATPRRRSCRRRASGPRWRWNPPRSSPTSSLAQTSRISTTRSPSTRCAAGSASRPPRTTAGTWRA
jgi:FAD-dependent urate hydroxylase